MPSLPDDAARYVWMLSQHQQICGARAYMNVVTIARSVGCMAFGFKVDEILAPSNPGADVARQKIMAFAHFATRASFNKIGRAFGLDHSSAMRSFEKYGPTIEAAVAGR